MNAVAGGSDVSAAGEVLSWLEAGGERLEATEPHFTIQTSLALPGKLAGLAQWHRLCVLNRSRLIVESGLYFLGSGDVVDDVLVLDGGVLFISGGMVAGDIDIEQGGAVVADQAIIGGKVKANRALLVELSFCNVGGSQAL